MKKERKFNKKSWIISALRRTTRKYPPANKARNRTKEVYYIKSKNGKDLKRVKFTCELCGKKDLKQTEMNLDHISPCVPVTGWDDWNGFIERFYCDEEQFQHICISCHEDKSKIEQEQRLINKVPLEKTRKKSRKSKKKLD